MKKNIKNGYTSISLIDEIKNSSITSVTTTNTQVVLGDDISKQLQEAVKSKKPILIDLPTDVLTDGTHTFQFKSSSDSVSCYGSIIESSADVYEISLGLRCYYDTSNARYMRTMSYTKTTQTLVLNYVS